MIASLLHHKFFNKLIRQYRTLPSFSTPTKRSLQSDSLNGYCSSKNLRQFRNYWIRRLQNNDVPEPELSVKHILRHVQSAKNSKMQGVLSDAELSTTNLMLQQRLERMPVQYIIGEWDFRNVTLIMRPPVFIPRPLTEQLVGLVLEHCCPKTEMKGSLRFLDIGCGSGAISISLLQECHQLVGFAVDVSDEALKLAQENAIRNDVIDRLSLFQCTADQCTSLFPRNKMDFIVSNPPYITKDEMKTLQPEIIRYEDPRSLDGGEDGMSVIATILQASRHILKPRGQLWLEIGLNQDHHLQQLVKWQPEWEMGHKSIHNQRNRLVQLVRL